MSPFKGLIAIDVFEDTFPSITDELPLHPDWDIPIIRSICSWGIEEFIWADEFVEDVITLSF